MIKLYSTGCPKCKVLKIKMSLKNIAYEEINDINEMKARGFMSAPMLDVDGKVYAFSEALQWVKEQEVRVNG